MSLEDSKNLKELPDLSNATNLESLMLNFCFSLVEIPSSIGNLQNLESLDMEFCINLQTVQTHLNLASLESVNMFGCYQLRKIPDIFKNVTKLFITDTMLQDLSESIRLWSHLQILDIYGSGVPTLREEWIISLDVDNLELLDSLTSYIKDLNADIEKIPDWIKDLHGLEELSILGCPKLASLLRRVIVFDFESLETLMPFPSESLIEDLYFSNCFKLDQEARRVITQQSREASLPGKNIPAEFDNLAIASSLTIPSWVDKFRICVVVSPKQQMVGYAQLLCRQSRNGFPTEEIILGIPELQTDHLFISHFILLDKSENELFMEFSTTSKDIDITECGFQIFTDKTYCSYESISV